MAAAAVRSERRSSRDVPDPARGRSRRLVGRLRPAHDRGRRVQDAALARAHERRTGGADHERATATCGLGSRRTERRSSSSRPLRESRSRGSCRSAGGEPRPLAEFAGPGRRSRVVARRTRASRSSRESGEERFRVGDPEKPTARRITDLNWRLDGAGIRDQFTSLWVVPARGGRPKRLTAAGLRGRSSPSGARTASGSASSPTRGPRPACSSSRRSGRCPPTEGARRSTPSCEGEIAGAAFSPSGKLAYVGLDDPSFSGSTNLGLWVRDGQPSAAARRGARPHVLLHRHRRPASTSARSRPCR